MKNHKNIVDTHNKKIKGLQLTSYGGSINFKKLTSYSIFIRPFKNYFDNEGVSMSIANKGYYNKFTDEENHKFLKLNLYERQKMIKEKWKKKNLEAISIGNGCDIYMRWLLRGDHLKPLYTKKKKKEYENKREEYIKKFYDYMEKNNAEIVAFDKRIYSEKYLVCGIIDFLLYLPVVKKYVLFDLKSNDEISNVGFQNMLGRFEIYPDSKLIHYSLQLYFYKIILEEYLPNQNIDTRLLHVTNDFVKIIEPINVEKVLREEMEEVDKERPWDTEEKGYGRNDDGKD